MANEFSIKKGLTLNLKGKAPEIHLGMGGKGKTYAVVPSDYVGFTPKLAVQVGDRVLAGAPIVYHKASPELKLTSPVSGEVVAINRGAKRKILSIEVHPDAEQEYKAFDVSALEGKGREELLGLLLESGLFAFFKQRPYDRLANPSVAPRDIFVTANFTAPLAPNFAFVAEKYQRELELACKTLARLTSGKLYLGLAPDAPKLPQMTGVEQVVVRGAHPAGLVGTLIGLTAPINKDEVVWTLKATDLLVIGKFLATGRVDFSRLIALTGSEAKRHGYVEVLPGARFAEIFPEGLSLKADHTRLIDGDVLTGVQINAQHEFMSCQCDQVTAIPEGDDVHDMFGWALPGIGKFSMSRTFFSWLAPKSREYVLDARLQGGVRAMIMSGEYDKVFALDLYPEFLLKSIIAFNITDMENRGIYEVAPEDFALCEFVDTSKMPLQQIVREGLDELYKEMN
ncbi:MAG: Na(+)-translocating NADH-quinone reductase subunit A [Porphyromonadaceae bacterium]|nr:Na(+)-translocating NADH-quinone reductase subunit A [Porphyromonadaceae bacterium]